MANIEALKFCYNLEAEDLKKLSEATHLEVKSTKCFINVVKLNRRDYIGILDALEIDKLKLLRNLTENDKNVEFKWLNFFLNSLCDNFIFLDITIETGLKQNYIKNLKTDAMFGHNFKILLGEKDEKYLSTIIQYFEKCFNRRNLFKAFIYQIMEFIPNKSNFDFNVEMLIDYGTYKHGKFGDLITVIKDTVMLKSPEFIRLKIDGDNQKWKEYDEKINQITSIFIGIYHIQNLTTIGINNESEERQPEIFHTTERQNEATENLTATLQKIEQNISYRNLTDINSQITTLKSNVTILRNLFCDTVKQLFVDSSAEEKNYANFLVFPLTELIYISIKEILFIFQRYLIYASNRWMFRYNATTTNEKISEEKIGIIFTECNLNTLEDIFLKTNSNIYFMFDSNFENINREPLILISGKAKLFGCILTDMDTVEKFEYTNNGGEKVLEKCKCDSVGYRYWLCLTCSTLLQKCGTNHILCKCGKQEDSKKLERFCFSQKASFKFGDALIRCDKQVIEETVYVENVVEEIVAEEFAQEDAVAEEVENIVESSTEDEENDETIVKSEEILLQRTKDFSTETLNIQADEKNHMNVNQMCESKYENIPAQENASSDSEGETCHFTAKQKLHAKNTSLESLNPEHSAKIVTNHIYETPPDMNIYDSPPDLTTEIQSDKSSSGSSEETYKGDEEGLKPAPNKALNFLIVGETGVGKSSFINSIPNYIKYENFKEALKADKIQYLIPPKINIQNGSDKSEEINISSEDGSDTENIKNEDTDDNKSESMHAKCYTVEIDENQICFIDTPGYCNKNRNDKDMINLKKIQQQMKSLDDEIYGVCFIIPANTRRLTPELETAMKNILSIFTENEKTTDLPYIYFIITHSNLTHFKAENSMASIKEFVKNYEKSDNIEIPVTDENIFCIDNESFESLSAKKQGIKFSKDAVKKMSHSWNYSAAEIYRFLSTFDIFPDRLV